MRTHQPPPLDVLVSCPALGDGMTFFSLGCMREAGGSGIRRIAQSALPYCWLMVRLIFHGAAAAAQARAPLFLPLFPVMDALQVCFTGCAQGIDLLGY